MCATQILTLDNFFRVISRDLDLCLKWWLGIGLIIFLFEVDIALTTTWYFEWKEAFWYNFGR